MMSRLAAVLLLFLVALRTVPAAAAEYQLAYSGRLVDATGKALAGPAALSVRFFSAATGGQQLGPTYSFPATPLTNGLFRLNIGLTGPASAAIFNGFATTPVFIELQAGGITYPRQQYTDLPYALRVPTDDKTIVFTSGAKLALAVSGQPAPNQFLTADGTGALIWVTPDTSSIGITQVSAQAPLVAVGGGAGGQTPQLSLPAASAAAPGYLSAADWARFSSGLSPTGGALSGPLALGGHSLTGLGTPTSALAAATKSYVDTTIGGLPFTQASAGSGAIVVWNSSGSGGYQLAVPSPLGITSINGDTAAVQSFAVTTSGAALAWSAGAGTHTLAIPLANASGSGGVGLLSGVDYLAFNAKQNNINSAGTVNAGTLTTAAAGGVELKAWGTGAGQTGVLRFDGLGSGTYVGFKAPDGLGSNLLWTLPAVIGASGQVLGSNGGGTLAWLAGAAPSGSAGGDLSGTLPNPNLAAVGTAGTYTKVTTDAKGRVIFGTSVTAADLPALRGDSGSGGVAGLVPAPSAGSGTAAFLAANGTWSVPAAAGIAGGDLTGTFPNPTLIASGVTAGTYTKVSVDGKGRILSGMALLPADIPALSAAQITSGSLAPSLGGTGQVSSAVYPTSGIIVTEAGSETLTAKTWNATAISGASTIGGATTINTTSTLATGAMTVVGPVSVQGNGTTANKVSLADFGSGHALMLKAPDSLSTSVVWTLPPNDGATGQAVATNGSGSLSWTSGVALSGPASGDLSGSFPSPSLAVTGVTAGTYTKVGVDSKGRIGSGGTLVAADIPPLDAAVIASGALATTNGGTGASSFTSGGVLIGNGTANLVSTPAGLAYQVLAVPAGGGVPVFGALNLAASAAVSGLLPTASGGTGTASTAVYPGSGVIVTETATETLTNKTLVNAVINGASTIGGTTAINSSGSVSSGPLVATTITTSGTLTAATLSSGPHTAASLTTTGNVTLQGSGGTASKLLLNDKGTSNALGFKAPDTLSTSTTWVLPATDGSPSALLMTNGSGSLSWASGVALSGPASGDLAGTFPSPSLAATGVAAGTYTKVSVDLKGRIVSGTTLTVADLPPLPTAQIGSGALSVAQGGLGISSLTANGVVLGNNTGNLYTTAAGTSAQVFRQPGSGSVPGFGAIDLTQAGASVTGALGLVNGGTGATTATAARAALNAAAAGANADITALTALTTPLPVVVGGLGLGSLTADGVVYGSGTAPVQATAAGLPYQALHSSTGGLPVFGAINLQNFSLSGSLPIAAGGTGLAAAPADGQLLIGNGTGLTLATLTAGSGITVASGAGSVTITPNVNPSTYVAVAGSTMTGALTLPASGLVVGSNQLAIAGGNVGVGSAAPVATLDIGGTYRTLVNTAAPATCSAANDGAVALTANYGTCVCGSGFWYSASTGATCSWPLKGEADYTTPGTYTWVVPAGVTSVAVVVVGGGGGGVITGGGGGGALCYANNVAVTTGASITVVVGAGGFELAGGASSFNGSAMVANGGALGTASNPGAAGGSGTAAGGVCNSGGRGGYVVNGTYGGGGGGAAGYSGNGGNGGNGNTTAVTTNQTAGAGGGGGGGGGSSSASGTVSGYGFDGGGVGLYGIGASGAAGSSSSSSGGGQSGGGGGSGGVAGSVGGTGFGGNYGGGGLLLGGSGAVRIIWGAGRSFPNSGS